MSKENIEEQVKQWANAKLGESFNFREYQLENICSIIEKILGNENSTQVVEAPTGSGKSLIVIISAGVLADCYKKKSYILCSDLYLWDQYEKYIKEHHIDFGVLKGQSGNYQCRINKQDIRNSECHIAGLRWSELFCKQPKMKCARACKYIRERKKAIASSVTLMTYQLFLYVMAKATLDDSSQSSFKCRDIIFCDECHNIPSIIQGKFSPIVSQDTFEKLEETYQEIYNISYEATLFKDAGDVSFSILEAFSTWAKLDAELKKLFNRMLGSSDKDAYMAFKDYYKILELIGLGMDKILSNLALIKMGNVSKPVTKAQLAQYKLTSWHANYMCYIEDFQLCIAAAGEDYVVREVIEAKDGKEVKFSCAKEDLMIWNRIMSKARHRVMLSATVGSKESYADNIGEKYMENSICMSKIPSSFDFHNSPVIYYDGYKMSYSEKKKSMAHVANMIYSIAKKFKGMRGIIQSGSYSFAKEIYGNAPYEIKRRLLMYENSKEKDTTMQNYKGSKDSILIGPTLVEGIDLPDDLCRFIIIAKVPYPSLTSAIVKKKQELYPLWYDSTTANQIIQGIGRGVRHNGDWCITYILDGCFTNLYSKTKSQFPIELQKRISNI